MTENTRELVTVLECFVHKGEFQKGLIIGLMLNEEQLDKALEKMKETGRKTPV